MAEEAPKQVKLPQNKQENEEGSLEKIFEGCHDCVIFCHAGCPDGIGAAKLMEFSLDGVGVSKYESFELSHSRESSIPNYAQDLIHSKSIVIYVDISPSISDVPVLIKAKNVLVLDHHISVVEQMAEIQSKLPNLFNLSATEGNHCGASLVALHFSKHINIPKLDWIVAILRKNDVWKWGIPSEWAEDAESFRSYVNCFPKDSFSFSAMNEFLINPQRCLEKGRKLLTQHQEDAKHLFDKLKLTAKNHQLSIYSVVKMSGAKIDSPRFFELCASLPLSVILRISEDNDSGKISVSVGRNCDDVGDLGRACGTLADTYPDRYISGGGHPFAAGIHSLKNNFNLEQISQDLLQILTS